MGCTVTRWTDSDVLESIGSAAFTDCDFSTVTLPNSLKELGHLAFSETGISTIHIGTGLAKVTGTPFYAAYRGKMYVDKNVPLELTECILDPDNINKWTLYVPQGSKKAYSNAAYWENFGTILEDTNLSGDGTVVEDDDEDNDEEEGNVRDGYSSSVSYTIAGRTFKTVKVESKDMRTFFIMQTEVPINIGFAIGSEYIECIDSNNDGIVIKREFSDFLNDIRNSTGIPFRLPTKEEWMFAAKGGDKSLGYKYSGSDNINDVAWYKDNCSSVHEFAQKASNELGLYDMSGNYAELCNNTSDLYCVDDISCGGSWKVIASKCTSTSWEKELATGKITGTKLKHKNAFDSRYVGLRLVYSSKDE